MKNYLQSFNNSSTDYDSILEVVRDAEYVLIGESTHGTHEFYQVRAEITKQLILEKGFHAVAIEGDWPDTYHINRYVRGDGDIKDSNEALAGFKRFPTWMWRNKVVVEFIEWLRCYNSNLAPSKKVGFYGLDLYNLNASIEAVLTYLEKVDTEAAERAKQRYDCFYNYRHELKAYGYATTFGLTQSCEKAVIEQLVELNKEAYKYLTKKNVTEDEFFNTMQNALLVKSAEEYYRFMFSSGSQSWNIRDTHMAETLDNIAKYITKRINEPAKIVVWAHNSHIGDSRATQFNNYGQINIGQLAREKYGHKAILIGFLTHHGTVTAASVWGGVAERKIVRPSLHKSYEELFHSFNISSFYINFKDNNNVKTSMPADLLERAIGVIYLPYSERVSHYFYSKLSNQFDIIIYLDNTKALVPLEPTSEWHKGEVFETFPSGL